MSKSRQRTYQDVSKTAAAVSTTPAVEDQPVTASVSSDEAVIQEGTDNVPPYISVELSELREATGYKAHEVEAAMKAKAAAELKAAEATQEEAAPVVEVPTPAAQEPLEVIRVEPVVVPSPFIPVEPAEVPQGNPFNTTGARLAYEELNDYLRALSKRTAPTQDQGAALQAGLHRALLGAINAPAEEFNAVMEYFLSVFRKEQEGVFSARNRFRWITSMNVAPVALDNFKQLVTLFTTVADPKARGLAVRQTPWQTVLNYRLIKEESRQRVLAFFGV